MALRLQLGLAMNRIAITALLVSCFSSGALGCSATASMAPRSPAAAFDSGASNLDSIPTPDGTTQVIATHVVPKAGVSLVADGDRIGLRYATEANPRVTVALDPASLQIVGGETSPAGAPSSLPPGPASAELADHGHLVAWTEGSLETGFRVRATTVAPDGSSDTPVRVASEGSAVGQPVVAVTGTGTGVVAFIESNGDGFQLVVKRVDCATSGAVRQGSSALAGAKAQGAGAAGSVARGPKEPSRS
jgi:hypothetical protein